MTTSPQFRQALIHNLERLNNMKIDIDRSGTLYTMYLKDYSKRGYLKQQKQRGLFRNLFLQKVF
jgi:hypothetical protein